MKDRHAIRFGLSAGTGLLAICLLFPALAGGCSFDPLKYFSKNACDMLNCDVLFFLEDLFPLSARPAGGGGDAAAGTGGAAAGGGDEAAGDATDEHAGH